MRQPVDHPVMLPWGTVMEQSSFEVCIKRYRTLSFFRRPLLKSSSPCVVFPANTSLPFRIVMRLPPLLFCLTSLSSTGLGYSLVREYSGANFFNDKQGNPLWDFYGSWDNLTQCVHF